MKPEYRRFGEQSVRLDKALVLRGLVSSRSRAEQYILEGNVSVNGMMIKKASSLVAEKDKLLLHKINPYVSRGALKLESANDVFHVSFKDANVLDIGSSTGGFTDYALKHGAKKVFAVDVGTNQLDVSLRNEPRIALYEKTDIRDFVLPERVQVVVMDVSFISLKEILPSVKKFCDKKTLVFAMVKPQFEAGKSHIHKGVIKNEKLRRNILADFEQWLKNDWIVVQKTDSRVHGEKGNIERFFLLRKQ